MNQNNGPIIQSQPCDRVSIPLLPIHVEFLTSILELDLIRIDDYISIKSGRFEKFNNRYKAIIQRRFSPDAINAAFAEEKQDWENVRQAYLQILQILKNGLEEVRHVA
jgi:hypothetical protein